LSPVFFFFYLLYFLEIRSSTCYKILSKILLTSEAREQIEWFKKAKPEVTFKMEDQSSIQPKYLRYLETITEKLTFQRFEDDSDDFDTLISSPFVHIEIITRITPGDENTRMYLQNKTTTMVETNKKNFLNYTFSEELNTKILVKIFSWSKRS
jgi:hypothetical protein